jgi:ribokinase
MQQSAKVVVVGSINMDLVIRSPRIPLPGETILGRDFKTLPGGKGANQAVAASRLGAQVEMIGCVGDDGFGRELLSILQKEGIGTQHVPLLPLTPTGIAMITVSDQGENTIVISSGANGKVTPEMVRQAEQSIAQADILLVQLEIPLDAVEEAVRLARRHQVTVILNPAPAQPLPKSLLAQVDILTPNETEGKLLVAQKSDIEMNPQEIIQALSNMGPSRILLTHGEDGVYFNDVDAVTHIPAYKVQVVDTTAAGDCFNAGLAVSLAEGSDFKEAIRFAQKAASLSVTRFGAQPSLPFRSEVEKAFQSY